jgi:hypothetical protein
MSDIIGGRITTGAGRMVNGKFVPLSAAPKQFKAPAQVEVAGIGASIGAKSSRVTADDLLKSSGFMSELKTSSSSPTAFAQRIEARRAARAAKSASTVSTVDQFAATSSASEVAEDMCNSCGGGNYGQDKEEEKDRGFDSGSDSDSDEDSVGF